MSQSEPYQDVVLGSGEGGKYLAWHLARSGRRTAVVERLWIGGSCPKSTGAASTSRCGSSRCARGRFGDPAAGDNRLPEEPSR
jgi:hypothetical protein